PLGHQFTADKYAWYISRGVLLGTQAFGQQGNAWLAEAEIVTMCEHTRTDIVHFIDGELGGWLFPSLPNELFANSEQPACVITFPQAPKLLEKRVNTAILRLFDGIVTLCESQRLFLERYVDPDKVFLIPHGIDLEFFRPNPSAYLPARDGEIRALLVG